MLDEVSILFNDGTIIKTGATDNVVNGIDGGGGLELQDDIIEIVFSFHEFSDQVQSRDVIGEEQFVDIGNESLGVSSINTDSEFTRLLGGEEEDGTSDGLSLIEQFTILVIINLEGNVSQF